MTTGHVATIDQITNGTGNITVSTSTGDVITSGSSGIDAVNEVAATDGSTITVTAYGTIDSGSTNNLSGSAPAGIIAGYFPDAVHSADLSVMGTVIVNNYANITASAGYGIEAYNWGQGNVTVNDNYGSGAVASTTISSEQYGITANQESDGIGGDVTVNVGADAVISATEQYGIGAYSYGVGNITVSMAAGDRITSGSDGISAVNFTTEPTTSSITVTVSGTINSGANLDGDGNAPGGIVAGYYPNNGANLNGNVAGSVCVISDASITAAGGWGIDAFTFGTGNATVTTQTDSSVTVDSAIQNIDTGIAAFALDGGNACITNNGTVTAATGIALEAQATGGAGTGDATIVNAGSVTGGVSLITDTGIGTFENEGAGQITVGDTTLLSGDVTVTGTGNVLSIGTNSYVGLAEGAGSTASATVTDGVIDASGGLEVGYAGTADLTAQDGTTITASFLNIAHLAGSQGTVTITGANVTAGSLNVAMQPGSTGVLTISGPQTTVETSYLSLGSAGSIQLSDGAVLEVASTIENQGTINVDTGIELSTTQLMIDGTVTLQGPGTVLLQGNTDEITGTSSGTLDNESNISGAGAIGDGTTDLSLDNETGGIIDANASGHTLTINIGGNTITNAGTLEATNGGTLDIDSAVDNTGTGSKGIVASGGTVDVDAAVTDTGAASISNNGVLEFQSSVATGQIVTFDDATGTLALADPADVHATLTGLEIGDVIHLTNESVTTGTWNGTALTLNGAATAFTISGLSANDTFFFTSDGHGGTYLTVEAAPAVAISAIDGNDVINASEAAAGFTISGTASDSSVAVDGQAVTIDIINGSNTVVESFSGMVHSNGTWSVNVSSSDAQALSNGSYAVTANLSDVAVNPATEETETLTVAETVPSISAPTAATLSVGEATAISGVSVSESGNTTGETFTVTLSDTYGDLSVSGSGGTITSTDSGKDLTISGTLTQVNADLTTLSDTDGTTEADTITLNASDSFGNVGTATIDVTVNPTNWSGDTLQEYYLYPDSRTAYYTSPTFTVLASGIDGLDEPGTTNVFQLSANSTSITASHFAFAGSFNSATFNGFEIVDESHSDIAGVTIDSSTNMAGLTASDVTFGSDYVLIDWEGLSFNTNTTVKLDLTFGPDPPPSNLTLNSSTVASLEPATPVAVPVFTVPGLQTLGVNQPATGISGVSLSESGSTTGETFTVTLTDSTGVLAASGGTWDSADHSLTISGVSLSQVNSDLATLTDTDGATGTDNITLTALDSLGNSGTATIDVTVNGNGVPVIAVPGAQTLGVGEATAISGVSLSESGNTTGETFTVTLTDSTGVLAASGGTWDSADHTLTISGVSLSQVNSDLATLTDTDGTTGTDNITLTALDSLGNSAAPESIDVTANGVPVIAVPGAQTLGVGEATAISGVSLSESGSTNGETFTVTLTDSTGVLAASGGIWDSADHTLTISGVSLSQVNSDLATLTDNDATAGTDNVTLTALDSLGNSAAPESIDVTVTGVTPDTISAGGTLDVSAPSSETVTFAGGTGTLILDQPQTFNGQISGFTGTAPDPAHSDTIDLVGFDYASTTFSQSSSNGNLLLTATDGSNVATLTFLNFDETLDFASDGNGGTLITDPPTNASATAEGVISLAGVGSADTYNESVTPHGSGYIGTFALDPVTESNGNISVGWQFDLGNDQFNFAPGQTTTQSYEISVTNAQNSAVNVDQTVSVSIGGPGNDNFVFQPGIGADTIVNFNPQVDTIELDHFANIQTIQELASLITTDSHGDAVIDLGHNDSITLPGMNAAQLQAVLHSAVHLH
ncbi:MAG: hypothetical protein ABR973_16735 [Candidatus Acidiferrales bacterium]